MRELIFWCFTLAVAVSSVQSNVMYRKFRDIEIPLEDQELQEPAKDVISELRKEEVPVEVDIIEPVVLVKEEVIVPVETLRSVEPALEVEEPNPIAIKHISPALEIEEPNPIAIKNISPALEVEQPNPIAIKQISPAAELQIHNDLPEGNEISDNIIDESLNEKDPNVAEEIIPEVHDVSADLEGRPSSVKQTTGVTTPRPTNIIEQLINNNPIQAIIDGIRRPLQGQNQNQVQETAETPANPTVLQQLQNNVQNFQNQITSIFNPNQNNQANPETNPSRPPNIIETIQQNVQQVQQAFASAFRPPGDGISAQQQGPLQTVVSNFQNLFTGANRVDAATQASVPVKPPVNDKIDASKQKEPAKIEEEPADSPKEEQPMKDEIIEENSAQEGEPKRDAKQKEDHGVVVGEIGEDSAE